MTDEYRNHAAVAACALVAAFFACASGAPAATYTDLHNFCLQANCSDGASPNAGVIADASGNLYGTTLFGGANQSGTVYKIAPDGTETVLYSFCTAANCADGSVSYSGLIRDQSGNLYGTTVGGGSGSQCNIETRCGTVYRIAPDGSETLLYSFCQQANCADGANPYGGLLMDQAGNLYGTTAVGGAHQDGSCFFSSTCGTVFKLTPSGTESIIYSFCAQTSCADGSVPLAGLVMDSSGNLFGTTQYGGGGSTTGCSAGNTFQGCGTVFEIDTGGNHSVVHSFCNTYGSGVCADGNDPGALVPDGSGNLYGTTYYGGISGPCHTGFGCGTLFKLASDGTLTTIYDFCQVAGTSCADGSTPAGPLYFDAARNTLFGTSLTGGAHDSGTVFRISHGRERVIHSFHTLADGDAGAPAGGVIKIKGKLYGTTSQGGAGNLNSGTVFALPVITLAQP